MAAAEVELPFHNRNFAAAFRKEFKYDPGFYAAVTYVNGAVLEAALDAVKGKVEDKPAFMKALRGVKAQTVRGPVAFDDYGNVVGDVFIRAVERKDGRLVNAVQHTYPNVSQFWTYDPKASDFTGMLLKVRTANPDFIHLHGLVVEMPIVISQMRQLGMQQRVSTYAGGYNQAMIDKAGKGADGLIVTSLAPNEQQNPNVGPYIERWKKAENRVPNGLPYTQYLYDSAYLVAALYEYIEKNKLPATGENMRKALLAVKTFNLPLTGQLVINEDHTVKKPVNLVTVKDGKFVPLATVE